MRGFVFWLQFHWSLFLRVQLKIFSIGLDNCLAQNRRQAIIWTNADPIHWRTYAALGGDVLNVNLWLWCEFVTRNVRMFLGGLRRGIPGPKVNHKRHANFLFFRTKFSAQMVSDAERSLMAFYRHEWKCFLTTKRGNIVLVNSRTESFHRE